jgi:hypothetical protein
MRCGSSEVPGTCRGARCVGAACACVGAGVANPRRGFQNSTTPLVRVHRLAGVLRGEPLCNFYLWLLRPIAELVAAALACMASMVGTTTASTTSPWTFSSTILLFYCPQEGVPCSATNQIKRADADTSCKIDSRFRDSSRIRPMAPPDSSRQIT